MTLNNQDDPHASLSATLEIVEDALIIIERGLAATPSVNEARRLDENKLRLAAKREILESRLDALEEGTVSIPAPSPGQVAHISRLSAQVDRLTRESVTAQQAIQVSGEAIDLVAKTGFA